MWTEIYKITKRSLKWLWSITSTFFISLLTAEFSTSGVKELLSHLNSFSFYVGDGLFALSLLCTVLYFISKYFVFTETETKEFIELMNKYTDDRLRDVDISGNYSWGQNRTIYCCEDLIFGWKTKDIRINQYDDVSYKISTVGQYISEEGYKDFVNTERFSKTIEYGNNLPRVMLTRYASNYNKSKRLLLLDFKRTEWSMVSYLWSELRDSGKAISDSIKGFLLGTEMALPNSFCMQLLIETADRKIVLSVISNAKVNDYAKCRAATIGEQLDITDIIGNDYRDDFVNGWQKRAFREEFGLTDDDYQRVVDEDSFRILSLNFEADIYNFTVFCVVRLKMTFSQFKREITTGIERKETENIEAISMDDIPSILFSYPTNKYEYHPSTYLRILLAYFHVKGRKKASTDLIKAYRNMKKKKLI